MQCCPSGFKRILSPVWKIEYDILFRKWCDNITKVISSCCNIYAIVREIWQCVLIWLSNLAGRIQYFCCNLPGIWIFNCFLMIFHINLF